jgi:hypothetical protein
VGRLSTAHLGLSARLLETPHRRSCRTIQLGHLWDRRFHRTNEPCEDSVLQRLFRVRHLHPSEQLRLESEAQFDSTKALLVSTKRHPLETKQLRLESEAHRGSKKALLVFTKRHLLETKQLPVESEAQRDSKKALPETAKRLRLESETLHVSTKPHPGTTERRRLESETLRRLTRERWPLSWSVRRAGLPGQGRPSVTSARLTRSDMPAREGLSPSSVARHPDPSLDGGKRAGRSIEHDRLGEWGTGETVDGALVGLRRR